MLFKTLKILFLKKSIMFVVFYLRKKNYKVKKNYVKKRNRKNFVIPKYHRVKTTSYKNKK